MARIPGPGLKVPIHWGFTPDSAQLTYLAPAEDSGDLSLWAMDLVTLEKRMLAGPTTQPFHTQEEELRRERQRVPWEGITDYQFAPGNPHLVLIPQGTHPAVLDLRSMEQERLEEASGAEDAFLLGDGRQVVFMREGDLCLLDRQTNSVRILAHSGVEGVTCGLAEYVAQEEFDRAHGYFVSQDASWVAFEEVDARAVPNYPIVHLGGGPARLERHRYPFVGEANAAFRVGILPLAGGETHWLALDEFGEVYLVDAHWAPGNRLIVSLLARDQKTLTVLRYDPATAQQSVLWTEHADDWINVTHDMYFLDSGEILTTGEQNPDRCRHLVVRGPDGRERWLTHGQFAVTAIVGWDPSANLAVVESTKESPLERHVYTVDLTSGAMRQITAGAGTHHAVFSPDCSWYVDQSSDLSHSPEARLYKMGGQDGPTRLLQTPVTAQELDLSAPEMVEIPAADGTVLYGAVYPPQGRREGEKAPVIVSVYGGPHAQMVTREWRMTADLQAQYFAQHGFLVLKVDNRGSANRGKAFESAVNRRFGTVELEDQIAGVNWVLAHYAADPARVGIYGWSYGGYMTLTALLKAPQVFSVGVAGAPVADFRLYDTAYTERYMGTDENNHEGYEQAATTNFAAALQGRLLIIHGLIDENVHFRHTAQMAAAFTSAHREFELFALPETRHMPRGYDVLFMIAKRRSEFFERYLLP